MVRSLNPYREYLRIKDQSEEDRPREKLESKGSGALTTMELLANIIGSGIKNMNVLDVAKNLLKKCDNNLNNLAKLSMEELIHVEGIGKTKAAAIISALELGVRLQKRKQKSDQRLLNPKMLII